MPQTVTMTAPFVFVANRNDDGSLFTFKGTVATEIGVVPFKASATSYDNPRDDVLELVGDQLTLGGRCLESFERNLELMTIQVAAIARQNAGLQKHRTTPAPARSRLSAKKSLNALDLEDIHDEFAQHLHGRDRARRIAANIAHIAEYIAVHGKTPAFRFDEAYLRRLEIQFNERMEAQEIKYLGDWLSSKRRMPIFSRDGQTSENLKAIQLFSYACRLASVEAGLS